MQFIPIFKYVLSLMLLMTLFGTNATALNLSASETFRMGYMDNDPRLCFRYIKWYAEDHDYNNWDIDSQSREIIHKEELGEEREKDAYIARLHCNSDGSLYIYVRVAREEISKYQHDAMEILKEFYHKFSGTHQWNEEVQGN